MMFSANSSEAEARFRWHLPREGPARYSNCAMGYDRCPADQGEATDRGRRCCLCQRRIALGNLHQGIAWQDQDRTNGFAERISGFEFLGASNHVAAYGCITPFGAQRSS